MSQGCATAIHALFAAELKLGGFIELCGWLPLRAQIDKYTKDRKLTSEAPRKSLDSDTLEDQKRAVPLNTPVFLGHARDDDIVLIANGRTLRDSLKSLGMNVAWREYEDGGHWLNEPRGVDDIVAFLRDLGVGV